MDGVRSKLGGALLAMLAASASPLYAAGRATVALAAVDSGSREVIVEYGESQVRLQPRDAAPGYLLLRDGEAYSVLLQPSEPPASDAVDALADVVRLPALGLEDMAQFVSLGDTGRDEVVAGLAGRVHVLTYHDASHREHHQQLVLSPDLRARELSWALRRMGEAFHSGPARRSAGLQLLEKELGDRRVGVLRIGSRFRVVACDEQAPAAARFELPVGATISGVEAADAALGRAPLVGDVLPRMLRERGHGVPGRR